MSTHPLVEKAFIYERDDFVYARKDSFFKWLAKGAGFISDMRRCNIQVCLDLSLNTQYGLYAYLAGIHRRYGLDYRNRCVFLNRKIAIDGFHDRHVADYYLSVAKFLGIEAIRYPMSIGLPGSEVDWARRWIEEQGIPASQPIIGIAPCGGDSFGPNAHIRRWPPEYYAMLIKYLRKAYGAAIFVFAGPKESQDVRGIIAASGYDKGVYDLSNTTLGQTIALISRCCLFIGNDTGALRFADALQKKIIAFYGPADDIVYGPYPPDNGRSVVLKKNLPCRPCYKNFRLPPCPIDRKCLRSIAVEEAQDAAGRLLSN